MFPTAEQTRQPYSLWLDSADTAHPDGLRSLLFSDPVEVIEAKNGLVSVSGAAPAEANPFEILREIMAAHPDCWAAGLFGYDLGRGLEDLPVIAEDRSRIPDMAVGLYRQPQIVDSAPHVQNEIACMIDFKPELSPQTYKANIQKVIDYIHAGDIFQANLAQRFEAPLPPGFDPFAHYLRLRAVNPAPFAAYFNLGGAQIASCSPERFLKLEKGRVTTKPIKGTRPRDANPLELLNSEKDRAENIMIVDLLRNDLSKVCRPESVTVEKLCALESFASVHHLVSTVSGQLQEGKTALDLLQACFPGGSVTGAPKIRAMEIIEELEPTRRGPYCGCIGAISPEGDMDTNILIRTLVYEQGRVSLSAGGGIVADSNPDAEYLETLDKARAVIESFNTDRHGERNEAIQSHAHKALDCFVAGGSSQ